MDHDFPSDATGVAIPYGIYDIIRNHGSVYVGYSVDTGEFAVDCIKRWWLEVGQYYYKEPKILILADCGGSNGARLRLWKKSLEKVLCDKLGLHIRVCHYPPGKSKYNPIEHRLFSEIGGAAITQLHNDAQLSANNKDKNRAQSQGEDDQKDLPERNQNNRQRI